LTASDSALRRRGANSPGGRALLVALLILGVLGATRAASTTWLQLHNTLHHNGHWRSGKVGLGRSVMGSAATMVTRVATHEDRLGLGSWFGFQDFAWHEPLALAELDASFLVDEDRYMHVWFAGGDRGRVGIRVSRHDRLPTAWWVESPSGEFTHLREFTIDNLIAGWNQLELRIDESGAFTLRVNDVEAVSGVSPLGRDGRFGFRGGMDETWIDRVRIESAGGSEIVEDFANHRGESLVHLVALMLILSLCVLASRLAGSAPAAFPALMVAGVIAASSVMVKEADRRWIWPLYPDERDIDYGPYPQESVGSSDVTDAVNAEFGDHEGPPGGRILFLGTSQTWGSGASTLALTFVAQTCAALNDAVQSASPAFECINTGLPGSKSPELWKLYRDQWSQLEPDLVVANLGNNDDESDSLKVAMQRLVAFNQEHGVQTAFMLEPTTSDVGPQRNSRKHEALREIARDAGLPPPSEVAAYVYAQRSRGHLWWDFIHPADIGHTIIAEQLADDLLPIALGLRERALAEQP